MAEKCHMCLLGLILFCSLLTGTIEVDDTHEFCSSGGSVRLPCNNALSDCTSTVWTYSRHSKTAELIALGKKKTDTERHERLSLGSDCSLNITKVTKDDYGSYSCQQYVNGQHYGSDARVYLHFLHVSVSPSSSQIRNGSSVTLFCQLYHDQVSCDTLVRADGVQLIWENQAGVSLQTDSRYQISPPGNCYSTLTTTLLDEDHNTEWRCLVTQINQVKTSATYIVRYSDPADSTSETVDFMTDGSLFRDCSVCGSYCDSPSESLYKSWKEELSPPKGNRDVYSITMK
ncbi:contactin-3-like isoform X2 [Carassius auratus]|uniref:Contactin-3-like isoform X2 n=1 Tax=Carassius auratus TaxID=7957 RepID=A0A6P6R5B3_CARAU|nr:contactin-3-like isoform X2 [Carassius auratus]